MKIRLFLLVSFYLKGKDTARNLPSASLPPGFPQQPGVSQVNQVSMTQCRSPRWVAGTQVLELLPRMPFVTAILIMAIIPRVLTVGCTLCHFQISYLTVVLLDKTLTGRTLWGHLYFSDKNYHGGWLCGGVG